MGARQNHLVIFVRAPRIGAVKRRLAKDIGAYAAWRFYRFATAALLRRAGDPRWRCWLAVTPDGFASGPRFWGTRFWGGRYSGFGQGQGDLGRRMAAPVRDLPPGPVVIIGSDIPDLRREHIADAFAALSAADFVFGPAADGGYWLIGCKRRSMHEDLRRTLFRGVRWSTRHALEDTLANVPPHRSVAFLETLHDIDTGEDFAAWRKRRPK
ncbi:MAG: TIGR04282 family arsenosugar biosynthesis glycosyltransferase [Proteobacteria bacterium]|nr:TIGR04282 family arsenosugar biosynthesis glycosyltransferase [Pseudomonadota bacterium]